MKYSIIAIGDELLAGQVTDTNSGAIARMLEPKGWELAEVSVVSDSPQAIVGAINRALSQTDVVLTTGGLGPTKDDLTKQTLCDLFGGELREDTSVLENVKRIFAARSLPLNRLTATQAMVPTSCSVIQNEVGTAPIMWFEKNGKVLVAMPGVPFETLTMMQRSVMPALLNRFPSPDSIERKVVMVHGISESALAERLESWEERLPAFAHLAYLPTPGVVRLRLDGRHTDSEFLATEMERLHRELIALIPPHNLMATDDVTPPKALLDSLLRKGLKFATAESCTGGTIASRITALAGASASFTGGAVTYSNEAKAAVLGVNQALIAEFGAVSEPVVRQMAEGALRVFDADIAVATSGIAGPGGGSSEKPVGTVWMAVATKTETKAWVYKFPGSRDRVIDRAATTALLHALESTALFSSPLQAQ